MKPIKFPEQTKILGKPSSMTNEECSSLPVFTDQNQCISCWKGTWCDRLIFLFTGKVWVRVINGPTQPPVYIGSEYPFDVLPSPAKRGIFKLKEKWSYYTGW